MNQVLIVALHTEINKKNFILMVPYMTPEDEILQALEEFTTVTLESKKIRKEAEANEAATPGVAEITE